MLNAMMGRRGIEAVDRPKGLLPARTARMPQGRPHICFVAPHAWPVFSGDPHIAQAGGAEVQQSVLARLLAAKGYGVSMICHDHGQPDRTVIDGVTVHRVFRPDAGVPVLRFLHPRLTSIWRALRAVDADIYYCRTASMLVGIVTEFCRRRSRHSIYAGASDMDFVPGDGGQLRYARDRWLYRRGIATVDRIVAQNEVQRATCRANYGREARVIPSCYVPPERAHQGGGDRVLWVGTIKEEKRPELMLELAARLPHRRFTMIGGPRSGGERFFEDLQRRACDLPNVEFVGFLPLAQADAWFDRARVVVNTSLSEGMPNTFLQAWARGVPTLATVDVGAAVHRQFRHVEEGVREIESLFENQSLWDSASRRCREHFERTHGSAQVLERYARLFDELSA